MRRKKYNPLAVIILQVMITSEAIEDGGRRMFGSGPHNQYVAAAAIARAPPSTEDAFTVLPHRLEPAIPPSVKSRGCVQLPDPIAGPN
jgi:hypothetical protein